MSTSTRWTGQEPGGTELETLRMTGVLLDPSEAELEAAFRSGQARLASELGSPAAATDGQREPWAGRTRRPAVRAAVGLGLAATAASGLLFAPTATLTMPWEDDGGATAVPPASASAAEILQAAATRTVAVADGSWDEVRGDQFVYYRVTGTNRYEVVGESVTKISENYTGWFSVDGTQDGRATATYSVGDPLDAPLYTCEGGGLERALADGGGDCDSTPGLDLDAPTDADAMYDYLLREGDGDGSARSMFIRADDALRTLTPEAQAAVFGALSRVDGLIVTPGVKDAAGRPGIAVGVDMEESYRQDLIFDPETKDLLGGASAFSDGMADGYAIVERTIVDEVGQRP